MISLLDDFPKATYLSFASKLKQHLNAKHCFRGRTGGSFSVHHYAGEVVIPLSLQRRVEGLLQEHLDRTILNYEKAGDSWDKTESNDQGENVDTAENAVIY
ncbi:hypothetical protein ACS0TY_023340 [Phlomoides rotata]